MISCGFHPQFLHSSGGLAHFCFNGTPDNGQMGPLSVYGTFHHLYHWDCCYGVARRVRSTTAGCVRLCTYITATWRSRPGGASPHGRSESVPQRPTLRICQERYTEENGRDSRMEESNLLCAMQIAMRHNVARREHRSWLWVDFMEPPSR